MGGSGKSQGISWDECFMRMAHIIAQRSKDPSTQVGAIIVDKDHVVRGLGYNGYPRGLDPFTWEKEGEFLDTKYPYVCHAETNAIYNSTVSLKGTRIYTSLFPCHECAKAILQTGIQEVIYEQNKYPQQETYQGAHRLFQAGKITLRRYTSQFFKAA